MIHRELFRNLHNLHSEDVNGRSDNEIIYIHM